MYTEKLFRLSLVKFFAAYGAIVVAISLIMSLLYLGLLAVAGGDEKWWDLFKKSLSIGFSTGSIEAIFASPRSTNIFILFFIFHALLLLVSGMILQGFITARIIKPKVVIKISEAATFHPQYGRDALGPHLLFRLVNAASNDLVSISVKAFLVVRENGQAGEVDSLYYFPIKDIDPEEIPILESGVVWKFAIPVNKFKNSFVGDYDLAPHLKTGSIAGDRSLSIVVSGTEVASSSSFVHTFDIPLESRVGETAGFYCGDFDGLPVKIQKKDFIKINNRHRLDADVCTQCNFGDGCIFKR